jgi:threonine aldolase
LPAWEAVPPETNICLFRIDGAAEPVCARLRAAGVICYPNTWREVRLVVHLGIDDAAVPAIVERVRRALAA